MSMNTSEARELGNHIAVTVQSGQPQEGYDLLAPVLAKRTRFRLLDHIGKIIGIRPLSVTNALLKQIVASRSEGGWVVIASALGQQLDRDPVGVFARCRAFVIAADIWYAADIFGERIPGPALVFNFQPALEMLGPWREDTNRWLRRTVGVAVHFWAKRSRGAVDKADEVRNLLAFLEPMFEERDLDAVKGVGWGLKTLGRHYPDLIADWLAEQVVRHNRRYRALMLRKALTYLSKDQRARATGSTG